MRQLAKVVQAPASTLGAYFSGRHIPPAASTDMVRALLRAMGVEDDEVDAWLDALRRARQSSDRRLPRPAAPYRGLATFEPDDADRFFGRDRQTREILDRIADLVRDPGPSNGVLAVVGPSGAGKSSVLRAGVVAAVRRGALDDPDTSWSCTVTTPGQSTGEVPPGTRSVLVIDQFEEVFTVLDPGGRDEILRAVTGRAEGQVVVLGMRADFYAEAARVPALLAALQYAQVLIGPMSGDELRDAITLPARGAGTEVEDGLVELVLADLEPHVGHDVGAHDAGTLPLMSHALLAAWVRSDGRRLTIADYRATGGLDAAVQRTAEDAYASLTPAEQDAARSVFLRLVNVEGEVLTTRRRIAAGELDDARRRLVTRFVEHRLVTAGDGWYEISHEALLSAWPRLRDWIDDDRAGLVTHRQLTEAANAWSRAAQDPMLLARGTRLELADTWAGPHRWELNHVETDFLAASLAARDAARRAERRRLTRLRALLSAAAALAVVAVVLALVFVQARNRADDARTAERQLRNAALSRAAAFESAQLSGDDPALAQQLAIVALRSGDTDEARGALIDQSTAPIVTSVAGQQGPTALAVSGGRNLVAVSHAIDGSVHLYVRGHGAVPVPSGVIEGTPGEPMFALAFSPSGRLLAVGGADSRVRLWDVSAPARPRLLSTVRPRVAGDIESLAFSPDATTLAIGSVGTDELSRWDVRTPATPTRQAPLPGLPSGLVVQSLAYDPDGSSLAAGTSSGVAYVWSGGTPGRPRTLRTGTTTIDAVAFAPSRGLLFTADRLGDVEVWPAARAASAARASSTARAASAARAASTPLRTLHGRTNSQVNAIAVSPDGALVAAGSSDADLRQWSTTDWAVVSDTGNPGPVTGLAFTQDGDIASTAADGALRLQRAGVQTISTTGSTFTINWSANGQRLLVATNGDDGDAQLWDAADPQAPRRLGPALTMPAPYSTIGGSGALTPDGDLAAAGNAQGRVALWNTTDPAHPTLAGTPFRGDGALVESLAFSPTQQVLAVGGDDADVHLWDVADPAHPRELATVRRTQGIVLNVAISPDGRLLAFADSDEHGYLYDIADPAHPVYLARLGGFRSYAYGVAFSPDGRTVAVADADTTTRLYDIARPTRPRRLGRALVGPNDYDYTASFAPDGRTVAVSSNDGTVRLYKADGSDPLPIVTLHAGGTNMFVAAYSPNGSVLAGGGRSDVVTLWSTDVRAYARRVCAAAGSPISRRQWHLYLPDQPYRPPCR